MTAGGHLVHNDREFGCLLRQKAPVNRQYRPSDEGRLIRGKEQDRLRDLGRFTQPAHRMRSLDRLQIFRPTRFLREPLHPLGVDSSGRHRIHPDATFGPLDG